MAIDFESSFNISGTILVPHFNVGEILEINTLSETHVSGSGGGGAISTDMTGNVSGSISNVRITSSVYTKTKIWVKTLDGSEEEWIIPGEVSARLHHRLVLGSVFDETGEKGYKVFWVNATTGNFVKISTSEEIMKHFEITKNSSSSAMLIGGIFAGIIGAMIGSHYGTEGGIFGFLLPFGVSIYFSQSHSSKVSKHNKEAIDATNNMATSMLNMVNNGTDNLPTYQFFKETHVTQDQRQVIDQKKELVIRENRRKQGLCIVCGNSLKSSSEKLVGYCNACKEK